MRTVLPILMLLSFPQCCFSQFQSKFGEEWPSLKECLEFSEESGAWAFQWGIYEMTAALNPDGTFVALTPLRMSRTTKVGRVKTFNCDLQYRGKWELEYRLLSAEEKSQVGAGKGSNSKAYFLKMILDGTVQATATPDDEEIRQNLEKNVLDLYRKNMKGTGLLVLDEQTPYGGREKKSEATSLTSLNWLVLRDDTGRLPVLKPVLRAGESRFSVNWTHP